MEDKDIQASIQNIYDDKAITCKNGVCNKKESQTVAIYKLEGGTWTIHFYQLGKQKINRTFYVPELNGFSTM